MPELPEAPLILTLTLDATSQAYFDELRRQHFPPARNFLAAHLTLFHHLSGNALPQLTNQLTDVAQSTAPLPLAVTGLQFLGQGVAFRLENEELRTLHRRLQQVWQETLTPQDRQPLRPHVTVQNKVAPAEARTLHEQLSAGFTPFGTTGTGLHLWAYRNGPWESLAEFVFTGASDLR
ncbi:2'-5' RNA ligase family protein [Hymenobacter guriensis]|uniref:2'-5' RNA ligase family protein n=1 Tax=Hymenobacter guriensis TaxID=2793065 RepID=A0ABS0KVX6_9BACT|nr:2'-5' RNA ligase family protein [Hymenobacter guriensis]MBG8551996.1 2'-5' RNA ligase family protein [Hymenobacter guriensis]